MGGFQTPYFFDLVPYHSHWHSDLDVALKAAIRDGRIDYRHVFEIGLPLNVRWRELRVLLAMFARRYTRGNGVKKGPLGASNSVDIANWLMRPAPDAVETETISP